ncbi:hypothetical protein Hanom_Chr17g01580331 [Helianthus anomalus]
MHTFQLTNRIYPRTEDSVHKDKHASCTNRFGSLDVEADVKEVIRVHQVVDHPRKWNFHFRFNALNSKQFYDRMTFVFRFNSWLVLAFSFCCV